MLYIILYNIYMNYLVLITYKREAYNLFKYYFTQPKGLFSFFYKNDLG